MRLVVIATLFASVLSFEAGAANKGQTKYVYTPAQQSSDMKLTPTVGMTFNNVVGDNTSTSSDVGISAGMTVDFGSDSTVFETGGLFSQLNTNVSLPGTTVSFVQNVITVPAVGKTFFQGGQSGPYVRYGGLVDLLLSAKAKNGFASVDMKDHMNTLDLLGTVGIGITTAADNHEFNADFSVARSLTKINSDGNTSLYNQAFMLNVGMTL
jgi:hypothetical protein